ncbi:MAG: tetratricopeptide repeat protein [Bacteroidota bacterium]|nr:tetratricopeptide repeat protein [Bacteroidota bacterium]
MAQPKAKKKVPAKNVKKVQVKKNTSPFSDSKKAKRYFVLFFLIMTFVIYGNSVWNRYNVDDNYVTGPDNTLVRQGLKAIPKIFTTPYYVNPSNIGQSQSSDYRPIVKLTYALEYTLTGRDRPMLSHFINVLLYFFVCLMLFQILKRTLKNYNILFPFLITLLFMVHPLHTEVVASLKNRDELLAMFFALWGMKYLLDFAEKKKIRYLIFTLILFMIGYLSKSSIITFLVLYPLVLYFFTDMKPKQFGYIFGGLLVVILIAHFVPRLFFLHLSRINSYVENPLYFEKNFWVRTGTGMMTLLFYLKKMFFPYPLLFYYGFNMIPVTNWANIWVILSFFIHLGLLVIALRLFRQKHILSFAILFYLIALSMYSNIVVPAVGIVAERFAFVASVGFCIGLTWAIFRLFRTDPKSLTIEINDRVKVLAVIVLLVIPSSIYTIHRNRDWKNMFALYKSDIPHLDNSFKGNVQYASFLLDFIYKNPGYEQQGFVNPETRDRAFKYYRRAIAIYPKDYISLNELGTAYLALSHNPDSAMIYLRKAVALKPDVQAAWVNLGLAYRYQKKFDSAMITYNRILKLNPKEVKAKFAIADIWFEQGDMAKAIQLNEDVIKECRDTLEVPYINIAKYYYETGDTVKAMDFLVKSVQKKPQPGVCMQLAYYYRYHGDMDRAKYFFELAQQLSNADKKPR